MPQNFKELWGIISGIFDEAGELSKTLPGFELRPGQNRMVEAVFETFVEDGITAIEAGTGIGKTFAYLIPAVYISRALGEPVVISTKTINLQEQILNKDIPFMQNSLKEEFSAVMVKGWGNYLCLRRLRKIQSAQAEFDYEEMVNFKKLENWAKKTTTGDRSDIEFEVISRVWDQIKAEYSVCSNRKCPWYSKCFFFNNRRKQKKANILITNHALLFSHLASIRNSPSDKPVGILPEFKRLILDEAHHIEEVASDFLGESASSAELYSMMDTLLRSRGRLEESGLLPRIRALKFAPSIQDTIRNIIDSYCIPQLNQLKLTAVDFFYEVSRHPHLEREKDKIRLTPDFWNADYDLSRPYQSLLRELNGYRKHLSVLEEEIRREDEELSAEISGVICQLENYRNSLVNTWNLSDEDKIYSLEYNRLSKPAFVHFKSYPLSVSEILYKELFKNMKSVVLTSATLAINRSFGYLIHQLGLDKFDRDYVVTRIIESPFNFKTQALVGIPRDIPLASSEDFLKKTFMELARLIKVMKGRTFILFTSYRMLEKCHELLQGELEDSDIEILTQGDLPRSTLLKEFKRIEKAVLLGTDSFWEGVDVPGGDLECVVLMKLPFSVPTDPIIKARSDHLKKQGLNPFLKYHVPKAIIKFKQGFGRLIRNSNDRGIIIILDKRVIEKRYGKMFLNSLPPVKIIGGKFGKIVDYVGEWNEKRE